MTRLNPIAASEDVRARIPGVGFPVREPVAEPVVPPTREEAEEWARSVMTVASMEIGSWREFRACWYDRGRAVSYRERAYRSAMAKHRASGGRQLCARRDREFIHELIVAELIATCPPLRQDAWRAGRNIRIGREG